MDKIEKIMAEIERLKGELRAYDMGSESDKMEMLIELSSFIKALSDEPKKGYDPGYLQSCIDKAKKSWEGVDVDKFMDEIREREDAPNEELNKAAEEYAQDETMSGLAERAFKAGAEWMAGQGYSSD